MNTLMEQVKKSWKFLIVLALLGGLFGTYPYLVARVEAGGSWQGVVPKFSDDSLFYMTRANAAIHGEVVGNLYYSTSNTVLSPSFSLVDIIAGVPYTFLSPFVSAVWNTFLWNALLALLLGGLLSWLGYSWWMIVISWFVVESSTLASYMLRAGHTQIMFPYFLLFFILLLRMWYRDRTETMGKHDALILGFCAGFTPYLYTFLFQILAASLGISIALALLLRRMRLARSLTLSVGFMVLLSVPYLLYFKGITDFPAFAETMNHFFGVRSHFPSPEVYFFGRWPAILVMWSAVLWCTYILAIREEATLLGEKKSTPSLSDVLLTLVTVSLSTLAVMTQNVILGVDITAPSHANYFIHLILPLGLVLLARPTMHFFLVRGVYLRKLIVFLLMFIVVIKILLTIPEEFPNPVLYRTDSPDIQSMRPIGNPQYVMPALAALRSLQGAHVIAAPEPLNSYIPLYTGQHSLFSFYGPLYLVGTIESVERSLVSKLGQPLTKEGVVDAMAQADSDNAEFSELVGRNKVARKLCTAVLRVPSCATLVVARTFSPEGIVDLSTWFDFYQTAIQPHPVAYLRAFHVSEVVIDQRLPIPEFLRTLAPWYHDQYYAIYDVTSLR